MRRMIFLMALFYLIQLFGANPGIFSLPLELYLKETIGLTASQLAWFGSVWIIPWTIKPLWGIISDSFPLFGYSTRSYFFICYALSSAVLFWMGASGAPSQNVILFGVLAVSFFISFSDVLTDKLMITEGKSEGNTGILQAAQWSAMSFGGAAMSYLAGWMAKHSTVGASFYLTAFAPLCGLVATALLISEKKVLKNKNSFSKCLRGLKQALTSKEFLVTAVFIAALRLHVYPPVIYYQRDVLHFDKQFLGMLYAVSFIAEGVGALLFGFFIRKISRKFLLNSIIGLNVISTISLIFMKSELSAILIYIFVGFTGMIAMLGILEIAARTCPVGIEATAYALLMSVFNLFTRPGLIVGGILWERGWSFSSLVLMGSALTAACWLLVPLLNLTRDRRG